jgi:hypothetical protein
LHRGRYWLWMILAFLSVNAALSKPNAPPKVKPNAPPKVKPNAPPNRPPGVRSRPRGVSAKPSRLSRKPASVRPFGKAGGRARKFAKASKSGLFDRKGAGKTMTAANGSRFKLRDQKKEARGQTTPKGKPIGPVACVPTAAKMLMQARGVPTKRSVGEMYWRMHGRDKESPGTPFNRVSSVLNRDLPPGRRAVTRGPGQSVDTRHPFMASLRPKSGQGMGHAVLVTGVGRDKVTVADPGGGKRDEIPRNEFQRRLVSAIEIK